jgi:hypothetical protein
VSNGSCQAFSRLGAAAAPFLLEYVRSEVSQLAVPLLLTGFVLVACVLSLSVRDTGNEPLEESFETKK